MRNSRILLAEAVGTFILMLGGPGTAVLSGDALGGAKMLGIAFGFGLALLIAAYAVGPISGCHINPAVTLGLAVARKVEKARIPAYIVGQTLGALVGGGVIYVIAKQQVGIFDASPGTFATNQWGQNPPDYVFFDFWGMVLAEVILTGLLVFVVLSTTNKKFAAGQVGLTVGMTLTLIHLISIPVDNTSVNPVRSLGMAYIAGGDAIEQLWAFIVFPLVGAIGGALIWLVFERTDDDEVVAADAATSAS